MFLCLLLDWLVLLLNVSIKKKYVLYSLHYKMNIYVLILIEFLSYTTFILLNDLLKMS